MCMKCMALFRARKNRRQIQKFGFASCCFQNNRGAVAPAASLATFARDPLFLT